MMDLKEIGQRAKDASYILGTMDSQRKNEGLRAAASELSGRREEILRANEEDLRLAREKGMAQGLLDRLLLTPERIEGIVTGMAQVIDLEDPIGQVLSMKKRPNGLLIGQKRVPLGVVGIIYEARPNVTADAFGLCFKTGNAVILKGGSDAINSNTCHGDLCFATDSQECGLARGLGASSSTDTSRETTTGVHAPQRIRGCADPQRRSGTDPECGGKQHSACHRDRHGKLPCICG